MKRRHNCNRIKKNYPYSIGELVESLKIHKNTAHNWIKEGLKTIDNQKPYLVHGSDLREFLQKRQDAQKAKCRDEEFFCVKCQKRQKPFGNLVDIFMFTKTRGNLQGICEDCDTKIFKGFGIKKLNLIKKTFDVGQVHDTYLSECLNSPSNCDLN